MSIFKKKQNKKFNYQSRYYNKASEGSPFEIKGKFDDYRATIESPTFKFKNLFSIWRVFFKVWKKESNVHAEKAVNIRLGFIIGVLVLIFLYIIDFDLSIFFVKSK